MYSELRHLNLDNFASRNQVFVNGQKRVRLSANPLAHIPAELPHGLPRVGNDRLEKVAEHVRAWLFREGKGAAAKKKVVKARSSNRRGTTAAVCCRAGSVCLLVLRELMQWYARPFFPVPELQAIDQPLTAAQNQKVPPLFTQRAILDGEQCAGV